MIYDYLLWSFTTLIRAGGTSGGKIPISLIFLDTVDSIFSFISSVRVSANMERSSLFSTFKSAILNSFCSKRCVLAIITTASPTTKMINLQCFTASSSIKNFVRNMLYNPFLISIFTTPFFKVQDDQKGLGFYIFSATLSFALLALLF